MCGFLTLLMTILIFTDLTRVVVEVVVVVVVGPIVGLYRRVGGIL